MPQISLASASVAYNMLTKLVAADPQIFPSVMGIQVDIPPAAVEAANAGVIVKIGRPNSISSPTSIANAEVALQEGGSYLFPTSIGNDISLQERWINASNANAVIYCSVIQA